MPDFTFLGIVHQNEYFVHARVLKLSRLFLGNLLSRSDENFARLGIDDIVRRFTARKTVC